MIRSTIGQGALQFNGRIPDLSDRNAADFQPLSEMHAAVLVFDPSCKRNLIIASSRGFHRLTGFKQEDIVGQSLDVLLEGVPAELVSRSGRRDFEDYCRWSARSGIACMGELGACHCFGRKDGSVFATWTTLGHIAARARTYVASTHQWLAEGPLVVPLPRARAAELEEHARHILEGLQRWLRQCEAAPARHPSENDPGPASASTFYTGRLQERTIVFSTGASAARREPQELPTGCLLFGSAPLTPHAHEGLRYTLRVDELSPHFCGLPLVGFTRRRPENRPGLYPTVAKCLAQSVWVGGFGEAFLRRQESNFEVTYRKIPQTEVATWCLQPQVRANMLAMPAEVQPGDQIECRYTPEGCIQFRLNGALLFGFDVDCPPEAGAMYWPAVDICNSVSAMTLLGPRTAEGRVPTTDPVGAPEVEVKEGADREQTVFGLHRGEAAALAFLLVGLAAAGKCMNVGNK